MRRVLGCLLFVNVLCFGAGPEAGKDRRAGGFAKVFSLMEERSSKVIVETGCDLDGYQPLLFGKWASQNGARLFLVDPSQEDLLAAKLSAKKSLGSMECFCEDTVYFLDHFKTQIDVLYLDSSKFELDNPLKCQAHHLEELQAAMPHFGQNSIVMIDDCGLPHGGRGRLAIDYLVANGWKIAHHGYQVILVQ